MADWAWDFGPESLLDGLTQDRRELARKAAAEIALVCSLEHPEGRDWQGGAMPLRTDHFDGMLITSIADVRGEQILVVQIIDTTG
ncbi:hypothetical protein [Kitasatospora terrestris]|uniref:DUF4258 domain-containing protein n=1 Tax=Kitasatospora terrestris TaxID=258051 RepID=A0ABP9DHI2_9ACTN